MVKDFKEGTKFSGMLLVVNISRGVTNNGEGYINATLQDSSGQIEAKKWKASETDYSLFTVGKVIQVEGEVYLYKNTLQMKIIDASDVNLTIEEVATFLESAPLSRVELVDKLMGYINQIDNEQIKSVVNEVFKYCLTSFSIYPAASRNHHEYVGGLIYHTTTMLDVANALITIYPFLDKNYLFAGVILHDVGKTEELSGPSVPSYTLKGKLIGHISIMQGKVAEVCDKLEVDSEISTILQHLVLSHHGKHEFGSPVLPLTKEAELIYLIDNIDSKMNMLDKALRDTKEGEFTNKVYAMDNRAFYKTKPTK